MNNPFKLPPIPKVTYKSEPLIKLDDYLMITLLDANKKLEALKLIAQYLVTEPKLRTYFATRIVYNMQRYTLSRESNLGNNVEWCYLWHHNTNDYPALWFDVDTTGSLHIVTDFLEVTEGGKWLCYPKCHDKRIESVADFEGLYSAVLVI